MPYRSSDLLSSGQEGRELVAAAASRVPNSTNNVSVGNDSMTEGASTADLACPCNCAYVSRACCRSATGVVHEAPASKLGILEAPNSSLVCDGTTGRFRSNWLDRVFLRL